MDCGAKTFRWVLHQEDVQITLERARALCQTTTMGTREPDLRAAFERCNFETALRQQLTWDELNVLCAEHYVVVLYQCHYSVVVKADDESLQMYDPDYNTVVHRARGAFEPNWHDYEIDLDWTRRDYERAAILVKRRKT